MKKFFTVLTKHYITYPLNFFRKSGVSRLVREIIATMLRFSSSPGVNILRSYKVLPKKEKLKVLKNAATKLLIHRQMESYLMYGKLNDSKIKRLEDDIRKRGGRLMFVAGGVVSFVIGGFFKAATTAGALVVGIIMGAIISVFWKKIGVEWFLEGIKRDSLKKCTEENTKPPSNQKLPKQLGGIDLQYYKDDIKNLKQ